MMITYKTPSHTAFYHRQQFHSAQKLQNENISDWYKRLQQFSLNCEYENVADYMLMDKFVSGLGETDFEKISQIATWTIEELILVVIGNSHIFKNVPSRDGHRTHEVSHIKAESTIAPDAETESNYNSNYESNIDSNDGQIFDCFKTDEELLVPINDKSVHESKKAERNKKHIEKLKETGRYDEYKRKKAESAKQRRLKNKCNEQYLPPELQLLVMNERRRATRERVKRYRDRKSQKTQETIQSDGEQQSHTEDYTDQISQQDELVKLEEVMVSDVDVKPEERSPTPVLRSTKSKKGKKVRKSYYQRKKKNLECYMCSMKCSRICELRTHLHIFHPIDRREVLTCPQCPKTTKSREVLSRHLKKHHGFLQLHKCPCCDTDFPLRGQLANHMASQHPEYKPFVCETCGNAFKTKSELNSHFRKHTGEKRFKCGVCDLFLVSSSSYRNHMLTHTGERPFKCKFCGKDFRQSSSLRKHLISIHNEGEKSHLCTTCNKRFSSIYHLRIHVNVHTGERPYHCKYCGSTFSQPSALKAHVGRIHANELRMQQQLPERNLQENLIIP